MEIKKKDGQPGARWPVGISRCTEKTMETCMGLLLQVTRKGRLDVCCRFITGHLHRRSGAQQGQASNNVVDLHGEAVYENKDGSLWAVCAEYWWLG